MPRFTDADGRDWLVQFTTVEAKRAREELDVDLLDVGSEQLFDRLINDDCLIVDVLHLCCRQQCEQQNVDAVGFARGLRGDTLDAATEAFLEAYVSFFRKHRRAVLAAALAKTDTFLQRNAEQAVRTINSDKMDRLLNAKLAEMDRFFENSLQRAEAHNSGSSSPNGPPSLESVPTNASPSAS